MNRLCIALAAAALALIAGCQDNEDDVKGTSSTGGGDSSLKADAKTAKPGATGGGTGASATASAAGPLEYQEIRSGNKIYVVGSKEAAEQAKAGKLEKPQLGVGFGAPGEKVYFEDKNADALQGEFVKRRAGR